MAVMDMACNSFKLEVQVDVCVMSKKNVCAIKYRSYNCIIRANEQYQFLLQCIAQEKKLICSCNKKKAKQLQQQMSKDNQNDTHNIIQQQQEQQDATTTSSAALLTTKKVGKNLIAGAMARGMAATIMFPIDVVKTRLQFQRKIQLVDNPNANVRMYTGAWDAFTSICKEEGLRGMYKGLPVRLLYITPAAAVSFTVYEQFMQAWNYNHEQLKQHHQVSWTLPFLTLAAGGLARVLGTACRTPFDILKQQLQVEGQIYRGSQSKTIVETAKYIAKTDGMRGFWSGYGVTLMRDAPFAAIYFTSYESIKRLNAWLVEGKVEKKSMQHFVAGACAGAIATCFTIPIDVVKTRYLLFMLHHTFRLQTQIGATKQYNGIFHAFQTIYREEGLQAFAKGLGPRLAYIMPAAALTFTIYEELKNHINI